MAYSHGVSTNSVGLDDGTQIELPSEEQNVPDVLVKRSFLQESSRTDSARKGQILLMPFDVRSEAAFVATDLRTVRAFGNAVLILELHWSILAALLALLRLLARLDRSASDRMQVLGLDFVAGCIEGCREYVRQLLGQERLKRLVTEGGQNVVIDRVWALRLLVGNFWNEIGRRFLRLKSAEVVLIREQQLAKR